VGRIQRRLSVLVGLTALAGGLLSTAGALPFAGPAGADTGDPVSVTLGPDSTPQQMGALFQGAVNDDETAPSPLQHVELNVIRDVSGGSPQIVDSTTTDSSGSFTLSSNLSADNSYALRQKVPPGWSQDAFTTGGGFTENFPAGSTVTDNGPPGNGPTGVGQTNFLGPTSITNDGTIAATGAGEGLELASGDPVTISNDGSINAEHPIAFGLTTGSIGIALPPVSLTDTLTNPAPIVTGHSVSAQSGTAASLDPASFTVARYWTTNAPAPVSTDFTAAITWGDGTTSAGTVTGPDAEGNLSIGSDHTFSAGGTFTGSVTVTDIVTGKETPGSFTSTVTTPPQAPTISKSFFDESIPLGGQTLVSFTVTNPNAGSSLTGVGFTDNLPGGLVVDTPGNPVLGTCGRGTITAAPASSVISLSGATLIPGASCTFSVGVTGVASGPQLNTTGRVTSNEGGTGNSATASLNVMGCPKGDTAYLFTGRTKVLPPSTILGVFCVARTGQATYQQGTASGSGGVNINGSSNTIVALGKGMNLAGGTSGPTTQFTEVQPLKATGTYTLTKTS
jgi:hypothetical protein